MLVIIHNEFSLYNALTIYYDKLDRLHLIIFKHWDLCNSMLLKIESLVLRLDIHENVSLGLFSWRRQVRLAKNINASLTGYKYAEYGLVLDKNFCELYIMESLLQSKPQPVIIFIEDGAHSYYHNGVTNGGLSNSKLLRLVRKSAFRVLGVRKSYRFLHNELGGNKNINKFFLHFPKNQRNLYSHDKVYGIEKDIFRKVIAQVNSSTKMLNRDLFILDHSSTFRDCITYEKRIKSFVAEMGGMWLKFHPRENQSFMERFDNSLIIEREITVERLLAVQTQSDIGVYGISSTGLMSAKILGYSVTSVMQYFGLEKEEALRFFKVLEIRIR